MIQFVRRGSDDIINSMFNNIWARYVCLAISVSINYMGFSFVEMISLQSR